MALKQNQMKRFLLFAAILLLFIGCSESSTDEEPVGTQLSVSPQSLEAEVEGGTFSVIIATNTDWLVSSLPSWCSVLPMSGSGDATLTVTVEVNQTLEKRSGTIQLTASDQSADVTISQTTGEAPLLDDVCTAMDDIIFKTYCYNHFDTNRDGKISEEEANAVRSIEFTDEYKKIASIKGIEYFTNLEELNCEGSNLHTANLSANSRLQSLYFARCSNLTSVTIPNSMTTIGDYGAFMYCDALKEFKGKFASSDGRCLIVDGVLNSFAPAGLTSYIIPDGVTTIGHFAFCACDALTSITIPNGVTMIGYSAFFDCRSLTSVTIPDGVTTIGEMAFCGCVSLPSVVIPDSVTEIERLAFTYCDALTSVAIPDSVTTIGYGAFANCDALKEFKGKFASSDGRCLIVDGVLNSFAPAGLTSYTIPGDVTTIGRKAFSGASLHVVWIPDSVTAIGAGAFFGCYLSSVTIPNSVTTIGDGAFESCHVMSMVTIGRGVTTIGDRAFNHCTMLFDVVCIPSTPPTLGSDVFSIRGKIYVLNTVDDSIINAYKSADGWKEYADYIEEYE